MERPLHPVHSSGQRQAPGEEWNGEACEARGYSLVTMATTNSACGGFVGIFAPLAHTNSLQLQQLNCALCEKPLLLRLFLPSVCCFCLMIPKFSVKEAAGRGSLFMQRCS